MNQGPHLHFMVWNGCEQLSHGFVPPAKPLQEFGPLTRPLPLFKLRRRTLQHSDHIDRGAASDRIVDHVGMGPEPELGAEVFADAGEDAVTWDEGAPRFKSWSRRGFVSEQ